MATKAEKYGDVVVISVESEFTSDTVQQFRRVAEEQIKESNLWFVVDLEKTVSIDSQGLETWPRQFVHADWHPGNMLFRDNRVVAVIDYDSARLLPRIIDVANGALQFSILGGEEDVSQWPDYVDESRFKRFIRGYDEVMLLSEAEVQATPWLMAEALIAEAVLPIATTGTFGRVDGRRFLEMVQRKVYWITHHHEQLIALMEA